jgi:hypothetical protein
MSTPGHRRNRQSRLEFRERTKSLEIRSKKCSSRRLFGDVGKSDVEEGRREGHDGFRFDRKRHSTDLSEG